jgi:preprotein translocase subunit SecA
MSKFFLSLEDDLMRIFASDRLSAIMERLGMKEGEAIISPMVTRAIARAQRRVEEQNFSSRKHLLEYDDVMNQQRQVIYTLRREALTGSRRPDFMSDALRAAALGAITDQAKETEEGPVDVAKAQEILKALLHNPVDLSSLKTGEATADDIASLASEQVTAAYQNKAQKIGEENARRLESWVLLQVIDKAWKNHLQGMDALKDSVSLRGYGQRDPLQEYKKEGFRMFATMMARIEEEASLALVSVEIPDTAEKADQLVVEEPDESLMQFQHPDAASPMDYETDDEIPTEESPEGRKRATDPGSRQQQTRNGELIYHGSRSAQQPQPKSQSAQVKREYDKVGRNDPCPCGSGKKFKKCHGTPLPGEEEAQQL